MPSVTGRWISFPNQAVVVSTIDVADAALAALGALASVDCQDTVAAGAR